MMSAEYATAVKSHRPEAEPLLSVSTPFDREMSQRSRCCGDFVVSPELAMLPADPAWLEKRTMSTAAEERAGVCRDTPARVGKRVRQRPLSASGVAEYGDGDGGDDVLARYGRSSGWRVYGEGGLQLQIGTKLVGGLPPQPARSQRDAEPVEPTQRISGDQLQQLMRYVPERIVGHVQPGELA